MTSDVIQAVSVLAGFGTLIWCIVFRVILAGGKYRRFVARAKARGCYTSGRHTGTKVVFDEASQDPEADTPPNDFCIVTYRYYVGGKPYEHSLQVDIHRKRYGSNYPELTIYYDPRNPKRAVSEGETGSAPYRRQGCLMSLVLPILVGILTQLLLELLF